MTTKKTHKTHTAAFKAEAARQLKIYESQLYNWRTATEKKSTTSQREAELTAEVAKLKRQLADQAEDLAILKIPKGHTEAATYSRRIKSKAIRIYARTPAPVSPKANGDGVWRDAKWVLCLAKIK